MRKVWVIDTETTTTTFDPEPDGHIVEFGAACVDIDTMRIVSTYSVVVADPLAKGDEWVFRNTTLGYDEMCSGVNPNHLAKFMSKVIGDDEVTAYNLPFDQHMIGRDMPDLSWGCNWGSDLMRTAALIEQIPRRHGGKTQWPTAEASYNYLCPDDPCGLEGIEAHRAKEDAVMEAHILIELCKRGLYVPKVVG